jgi:hypothetical protein
MAKSKQTQVDTTSQDTDNFLFAIGTPEGDILLKVGEDGNIMYLKEGSSLDEASVAFWNSFQGYLPISAGEVDKYPNDAELGYYIRTKMADKLKK